MALLKRIKYVLTADKKEVAEQQTSNISARNKKIIQLLVLIGLCCIPIVAITGCSSGKLLHAKPVVHPIHTPRFMLLELQMMRLKLNMKAVFALMVALALAVIHHVALQKYYM